MPGAWPCAFPSGTPRTRCMKCVTLPDTCVEILPIPFVDAVVLGRVVADRERGLVPVETRDVVCEKRKHGGVLDPSTGQRVCFA